MKVVEEIIGNTSVMIQTMTEELEIVGENQGEPDIIDTGIEDKFKDAYGKAKSVIRNIAEDIGEELLETPQKSERAVV